jgi:hypothetical protein
MGFSGSWIAFHGLTKEEALARTSLRDTGEAAESLAVPVSGAELPRGWYVICLDHDIWSEPPLETLSTGCRIIECRFEEHAMVSIAAGYENGSPLWEITHCTDPYDLYVEGTPPPEFAAVRDRLTKEQDEAGGKNARVDFFFDIPIETAQAICGYHYEIWKFDWGEPAFTRLERM